MLMVSKKKVKHTEEFVIQFNIIIIKLVPGYIDNITRYIVCLIVQNCRQHEVSRCLWNRKIIRM